MTGEIAQEKEVDSLQFSPIHEFAARRVECSMCLTILDVGDKVQRSTEFYDWRYAHVVHAAVPLGLR